MKHELSLLLRERELNNLIKDAEVLAFAPQLISSYKIQLSEVRQEISQMQQHKGKVNFSQAQQYNTAPQIKAPHNQDTIEENKEQQNITAPFLLSSVVFISGIGYTTAEQEQARRKAVAQLFRKLDKQVLIINTNERGFN